MIGTATIIAPRQISSSVEIHDNLLTNEHLGAREKNVMIACRAKTGRRVLAFHRTSEQDGRK